MATDAERTAVAELRDRAERERQGVSEERDRQTAIRRRQAAWAREKLRQAGMVTPADARKLGENLFSIVADACRDGKVRKCDILAKAGMCDSDDKTRKLYLYTLDPALPEEKRKQRAKKLVKHPGNYLKLADTAAELAGLDADDTVCRLVAGTRLADGMDAVPDNFQPEYLDMLSSAIQGQARRISSETKIDWYFRTIETHDLSPTLDTWTADGLGKMAFHETVPTVELVTLELKERTYQGCWSPRRPDGSDGPTEIRTARPCLRVALTLAPLGSGNEVRAYFMCRHVLAVRGWADEAIVGRGARLAEFNVDVVGWLGREGASGNTAGTFRLHGTELDRFLTVEGLIEFEADNHEFFEVSPATIVEVLDRALPDAAWVRDDALAQAAMHVTKSPPGTRIAVLEDVLHYGRDPYHRGIGTPLMALVEQDARQRVASLRNWWDSEQAEIEEVFSRMASGDRL